MAYANNSNASVPDPTARAISHVGMPFTSAEGELGGLCAVAVDNRIVITGNNDREKVIVKGWVKFDVPACIFFQVDR